jgi:NADH-quinone oxidoreductase subunit J
MDAVTVVFWIFAVWAVGSAVLTITRANAISSALWLVSTMFALAGIYVLLHAEFIAVVQVLVYAGAVMVLFLFVIMLLNLEIVPATWRRWPIWLFGIGLTTVLGASLVALRSYTPGQLAQEVSGLTTTVDPALIFPEGAAADAASQSQGVVGAIAEPLFRNYLVPFEVTSILLLAAIVGAVVLAKRKL